MDTHQSRAIEAQMALEAYNPDPKIYGHDVTIFSVNGTQGFMAVKGNDLYVVFRGTDALEDWITNGNIIKLLARPIGYPDCHIHLGFYDALRDVLNKIFPPIDWKEWNNIYIVGHSLGGALAALLAFWLIGSRHQSKVQIITFGAPRCGDSAWAKIIAHAYDGRFIRVVRAGDLVPHIPSGMFWTHAGQEIFFDEKGVVVPPSWGRQLVGAARVLLTRRVSWADSAVLDSHDMNKYFLDVEMMK